RNLAYRFGWPKRLGTAPRSAGVAITATFTRSPARPAAATSASSSLDRARGTRTLYVTNTSWPRRTSLAGSPSARAAAGARNTAEAAAERRTSVLVFTQPYLVDLMRGELARQAFPPLRSVLVTLRKEATKMA